METFIGSKSLKAVKASMPKEDVFPEIWKMSNVLKENLIKHYRGTVRPIWWRNHYQVDWLHSKTNLHLSLHIDFDFL